MCHKDLIQFACGHTDLLLFKSCGKIEAFHYNHRSTYHFEPFPEDCYCCLVKRAASGEGFLESYPIFISRQWGWIWIPMSSVAEMTLPPDGQAAPAISNPQPYRPLASSTIQQIQARSSGIDTNSYDTSDNPVHKMYNEPSPPKLSAIYIPPP